MERNLLKNIDMETVLSLSALVAYQKGQVVRKTLAQNDALSLTLFAFDRGEEIRSHESSGDAMVIALEGEGEITIGERRFVLKKGDTIVMPAKKPHAVHAKEQFKMFLIVVFPYLVRE